MRRLACLLLLVSMLSGCAFMHSRFPTRTRELPGATVSPTQAVVTSAPATATPAPSGSGKNEVLDAFEEIAFTSEYTVGGSAAPKEIRKWAAPVKIAVHGSPTGEDTAALKRAMDGLNALDGFPGICISGESTNMDVWFVPLDDMDDVIPDYVQGNWGFFTVNFSQGEISYADVAIATDVTDQTARNHLIFEEVLQSTGLMQDCYSHADSIFYGKWTTVQQPTSLDWELLDILYSPELKPGMPEGEAMDALQEIIK